PTTPPRPPSRASTCARSMASPTCWRARRCAGETAPSASWWWRDGWTASRARPARRPSRWWPATGWSARRWPTRRAPAGRRRGRVRGGPRAVTGRRFVLRPAGRLGNDVVLAVIADPTIGRARGWLWTLLGVSFALAAAGACATVLLAGRPGRDRTTEADGSAV